MKKRFKKVVKWDFKSFKDYFNRTKNYDGERYRLKDLIFCSYLAPLIWLFTPLIIFYVLKAFVKCRKVYFIEGLK